MHFNTQVNIKLFMKQKQSLQLDIITVTTGLLILGILISQMRPYALEPQTWCFSQSDQNTK